MKGVIFDCKPFDRNCFASLKSQYDDLGLEWTFQEARLTEFTTSLAQGCEVVCCFVNDDLSQNAVRDMAKLGVKLILMRCAGYDNVDLHQCQKEGITVARVPAYSPNSVAEHALGLILTMSRKFHVAYERTRNGDFSLGSRLLGHDISSCTVGIVGTGKIGKILVKTLVALGSKVIGYDAAPVKDRDLQVLPGFEFVESLDDIWTRSDIISLHVPLIPGQTEHLVNDATIEKMKPGITLINTSRGGLIDTQALIRGLKTKKIGACALDVYEGEKGYFHQDWSDFVIPDDTLSRLMTFPNVLITPHQAFFTHEALDGIALTTLFNAREYIQVARLIC